MGEELDNNIDKYKHKKQLFLVLSFFVVIALLVILLVLSFKPRIENLSEANNSNIAVLHEVTQVKEVATTAEQHIKKAEPLNNLSDCLNLQIFIQEYYSLKLIASQGADFTPQLLELAKYDVKIDKIKGLISKLLILSSVNRSEDYLKNQFQQIIKEIYAANSKGSFFNNMIFIRAIGDKALKKEGIDKYVELSVRALLNKDLVLALQSMGLIPNSTEALNHLKIEIKNKLIIKDILNEMDQLFINNLNCKIVKG